MKPGSRPPRSPSRDAGAPKGAAGRIAAPFARPEGRGAGARLRSERDVVVLWGFHAVLEALRSSRRTPLRLIATAAAAERLGAEIADRGLQATIVAPQDLDRLLPREAVHQGVALEARPLETHDITDIPDEGTLLVLDQITDPHNVGAILRTAAAFGVAALLSTERHAPEMTGVLAKSASGGLEHVPIVSLVNLARGLESLHGRGYQLIGLDSEGSLPLEAVRPHRALALVLGAEGKGLRRLTRERCDAVARLDMPGAVKSLNVSNACAVALATLRLAHRAP